MTAVVDINRTLGPVPYDDVPGRDGTGLVAELDRLRIDAACVSHSYALHGDPRDGNDELTRVAHPRLWPVPVLVPGPLGTGPWAGGTPLVRLCPRQHGWDVTGPHARQLLAELAASGTTVLLPWDEVTTGEVHRLASAVPAPRTVLTGTGYRALRELAELLEAHPSLYVDTSTLCGHRQVEWVAERYGAHRVLFGTGAPATDDAGPRYLLDTLDLPPDDAALIAGGNALVLMGGGP
ncbi:amidohydrolase family protein [Streptomyces gobitricini]|uniref:Amidohydrolase-related domain-containing protein n=1 Tax=Streptomyces gobitricini TaxID=68211 RepID=A0ABP5Z7S3_9ACTN